MTARERRERRLLLAAALCAGALLGRFAPAGLTLLLCAAALCAGLRENR